MGTYRKWDQNVIGDRVLVAARQAWRQHGIGGADRRGRNGGSWLEVRRGARQSRCRNSGVDWIRIAENALVLGTQRQVRKCSDRQLNLRNQIQFFAFNRRNNRSAQRLQVGVKKGTEWETLSGTCSYHKRTKKNNRRWSGQGVNTSRWQMSFPNGTQYINIKREKRKPNNLLDAITHDHRKRTRWRDHVDGDDLSQHSTVGPPHKRPLTTQRYYTTK